MATSSYSRLTEDYCNIYIMGAKEVNSIPEKSIENITLIGNVIDDFLCYNSLSDKNLSLLSPLMKYII